MQLPVSLLVTLLLNYALKKHKHNPSHAARQMDASPDLIVNEMDYTNTELLGGVLLRLWLKFLCSLTRYCGFVWSIRARSPGLV